MKAYQIKYEVFVFNRERDDCTTIVGRRAGALIYSCSGLTFPFGHPIVCKSDTTLSATAVESL